MEKHLVKNRYGEVVERREWLKAIRKEKGLTVRSASKEMDMSWTHYSDIENSRRNPSLETAVKIARFYGFPAEKFIG